jgi:PPP family 3-phenylpropionic acid transporter
VRQSWRFLACVCLLQGAHAAYYGFSAIYWQEAAIPPPPWAICGRWRGGGSGDLRAEQKVFRRFSARDLLLLSACAG